MHGAPSTALLVLPLVGLSVLSASAQEIQRAEAIGKVRPGATALLASTDASLRLQYFLRLPASYDPRRGARLVVFLHGSNMNGLDYLRSFEAKRWCTDDILVCPNGEQGDDPRGQNNFTFASAARVAQVTKEVKAQLRVTVTYLGGHSQGAFVTYSTILQFPELYEGAFPMAGDCWLQNEPNLWQDKPDLLAQQKRIAIAVIHGQQDPVVKFSQGQHAHGVFLAMGYPKLRLFAPETLGHQFALAPVPEALAWLDAVIGNDEVAAMRAATGWAREKEWGWVVAAAKAVLAAKKAPAAARNEARAALKLAEAAARKEAAALSSAKAKSPPGEWVRKWFEFRRQFGETEAARPLVTRYEQDRAAQREAGQRLFEQARSLLQAGDQEKGREKLREILAVAPATYEAYYAVTWLDDAK